MSGEREKWKWLCYDSTVERVCVCERDIENERERASLSERESESTLE